MLCGRISLFLARSVALDDRSGVNIPAAVNLSNTTPIEDPAQVDHGHMHLQMLRVCSSLSSREPACSWVGSTAAMLGQLFCLPAITYWHAKAVSMTLLPSGLLHA